MTIGTVSAVQQSRSTVEVSWTYLVAPTGLVSVERFDDGGPATDLGTLDGALSAFTDSTVGAVAIGVEVEYTITDIDAAQAVKSAPVTVNDPDVPFTYGVPNPLVDTIRYTTLDDVKKALVITDTTFDADLTQAIIAGEYQMDAHWNRSFPDTGTNPQYAGIPETVRVMALGVAIGAFKIRDTTFGTAGSDEWIGAADISDQVTKALKRHPLGYSFKVGFGVA